jgi:hypothetical protein
VFVDQLAEDLQNCVFDKSATATLQQCAQRIKDLRVKCLSNITRTRQLIAIALGEAEHRLMAHFDAAEQTIAAQAATLAEAVPRDVNVNMAESMEDVNTSVKLMAEALSLYHTRTAQTQKTSQQRANTTQLDAQRAAETLSKVTDTVVQELNKLLPPSSSLPMQTVQQTVQHQPSSVSNVVWESAFSTEFKHSEITVAGSNAIRQKDTTDWNVCVMGATMLATSTPSTKYRCRVKILK